MIYKMNLKTNREDELIDITGKVSNLIRENGIQEGVITVFIPHTTAGVTINENADPDVKSDMLMQLRTMVPKGEDYKHFEGNSHAHIKASLMGFSENILVENGALVLGTWQGIYFCEFDGPRSRKVYIKI